MIKPPRRPRSPATLSPRSRALWESIVRDYPPKHFTGANLQLLENLCQAAGLVDDCNEQIAAHGLLIDGRANPAVAMRQQGWAEMRHCCTKLRLAISSLHDPDSAQARPDPRHALQKPWEE